MEEDRKSTSNRLRACINCGIIKSSGYFKVNGCPNCPFLHASKARNLSAVTSTSFKGLIGIIEPQQSWVAKWQRNSECVPGSYAMTVNGELPEEFIEKVERNGRDYINRSQSFSIE